jgi:hypothetical protein
MNTSHDSSAPADTVFRMLVAELQAELLVETADLRFVLSMQF